ncbi:PQ loop repeat-domain-containing protein, partial [Mycena pura]
MIAETSHISSMLGWVSLACWINVYSPQIYENYSLQSGEGLSVLFVLIWLLGDICNLVGAVLANLLPTVIILAIYYTLCDLVLMAQIYFYRRKQKSSARTSEEETPLLARSDSERKLSPMILALRYVGALIFVFATGLLAWWISHNTEQTEVPRDHPTPAMQWIVQLVGWTSAVLYLGSRIPQIVKNPQTRCEGLSPALFFFALGGNITYSLSIIVKSTEKDYLIVNASWLAGIALTVFLDLIV